MDEYIKREDAVKALEEHILFHTISMHGSIELVNEYRWGVEGAINTLYYVPNADVVPKSEVAILTAKLYASEYANECLRLEFEKYKGVEKIIDDNMPKMIKVALKNAKAEVAREIFEEADQIFMATCLSLETYKAWCELKKKYTEDKT